MATCALYPSDRRSKGRIEGFRESEATQALPPDHRPEIEVCSAQYGNNGWLGLAQIWVSGCHIVGGVIQDCHITQAVTNANDHYFTMARFNTPAWRQSVMCQEVGHTFGLGHQDEDFDSGGRTMRNKWITVTLLMATIALAKTSAASDQSVRAEFRDDPSDQVRSDATTTFYRPCEFDYVDKNDPCERDPSAKNSISRTEFPLNYWFFRTVRDCCTVPTRWLVLDFSVGVGSQCPDLDSQYVNYPGYSQTPGQPPAVTGCVDNLEVRLSADNVFNSRAIATQVRMLIDAPDLNKSGNLQWNVKWELDFVNPLRITRNPDLTTTIDTFEATAELWTIGRNGRKDTKLGTYSMPFAVTLKPI